MALILILSPLVMAALAFAVPSNRLRPWLIPIAAVCHTAVTLIVLFDPALRVFSRSLVLDPTGSVVLLSTSVLYFLTSFYAVGFLKLRMERSNRIFTSCLLASLGLITLVCWSHDLGITWVAIEGTTLVMAPLVYFKRTPQSIEATWKYLLVGSVGIALALLGTFFLAYASLQGGFGATMNFDDLRAGAGTLSKPWLRAAFILFLVGYGTKMGLAPMHNWKPDAYGEAPGLVGAIFAGGVTSAAFLTLTRIYQICLPAGEGAFMSRLLLFMGLVSMAVAGVFMVRQHDIKRLLAYSSVEHMGILVLGLGIGGPALSGTLFHLVANAMTKGILFLSAGNIQRAYASKNTGFVTGALRRLPLSGGLFLTGFIAITGSPPFAPFISEFSILSGAFSAGLYAVGACFAIFLLVVFIGMGSTVLRVVFGPEPAASGSTAGGAANGAALRYRDTFLTVAPSFAFLAIILALGVWLPAPLGELFASAARFLENVR